MVEGVDWTSDDAWVSGQAPSNDDFDPFEIASPREWTEAYTSYVFGQVLAGEPSDPDDFVDKFVSGEEFERVGLIDWATPAVTGVTEDVERLSDWSPRDAIPGIPWYVTGAFVLGIFSIVAYAIGQLLTVEVSA